MSNYMNWGVFLTTTVALILKPSLSPLVIAHSNRLFFESNDYWAVMVTNITICVLVLFDIILDRLYGIRRTFGLLIITTDSVLLTSSILAMIVFIPQRNFNIFWIIWNIRDYICIVAMFFYIFKYGGIVWSGHLLQITLLSVYSAAIISREYSWYMIATDSSWKILGPLLLLCSFLIVQTTIIRHFLHMRLTKLMWTITDYSCLVIASLASNAFLSVLIFILIYGEMHAYETSVSYAIVYESMLVVGGYGFVVFYRQMNNMELWAVIKKTLEVKRAFVRYVSHEVRSPLQSIVTAVSLLKDQMKMAHKLNGTRLHSLFFHLSGGVELKPELMKHISAIQDILSESTLSCKLACNILDSLLDASDILQMRGRVQTVYPLLLECIDMYELAAKAANVYFKIDCESPAAKMALANVDAAKMLQAVGALLSNAIKFSHKGGRVTIEMFLVTREEPEISALTKTFTTILGSKPKKLEIFGGVPVICIRVVDTGVGLTLSKQRRLMRNMATFHTSDHVTAVGPGIGLLMAYDIVKRHQGDIIVHSDGEGYGSVFSIELPLAVETSTLDGTLPMPNTDQSLSPRPVAEMNFLLGKLKVLCVDVAPSIRKLISRSLVRERLVEYPADEASNGEEALKLIKQSLAHGKPYDLVLMDMQMPVMNGPTTVRLARQEGFVGLIVGLTGNALDEDLQLFHQSGADDVLVKPMHVEHLKRLIKLRCVPGTMQNSSRPESSEPGSNVGELILIDNLAAKIKAWATQYILPNIGFCVSVAIIIVALVVAPIYPFARTSVKNGLIATDSRGNSTQFLSAAVSALASSVYIIIEVVMHFLSGHMRDGLFMFVVACPVHFAYGVAAVAFADNLKIVFATMLLRDFICRFALLVYLWRFSEAWGHLSLTFEVATEALRFVIRFGNSQGDASLREPTAVIFCSYFSFTVITIQFLRTAYIMRSQKIVFARQYCALLYNLIILVAEIAYITGKRVMYLSETTLDSWITYSYEFEVLVLVVTLFHTRLVLWEYFSGLNIIKNRRAMVRHVSHEIKTPINILSMGFIYLKDDVMSKYSVFLTGVATAITKYLADDMRDISGDTTANEMLDILTEMQNDVAQDLQDVTSLQRFCGDALSVLDDLLLYEKLDGDMLTLDITSEPAAKTLVDAVHLFMARGSAETFSMSLEMEDGLAGEVNGYLPLYCVRVDKVKMAHVINSALHFASSGLMEGGELTVLVNLVRTFVSPSLLSDRRREYTVSPLPQLEVTAIQLRLSACPGGDGGCRDGGAAAAQQSSTVDEDVSKIENNLRLYVCNGIVQRLGGVFRVQEWEVPNNDGVQDGVVTRRDVIVTIQLPLFVRTQAESAVSSV